MDLFTTLESILTGGPVLIDSCFYHIHLFKDFMSHGDLSRLSKDQFDRDIGSLERAIDLYSNINCVAIPELQTELDQLMGALKTSFDSRHFDEICKSRKQARKNSKNFKILMDTLSSLEDNIEDHLMQPQEKHFYDLLVDLCVYASDALRLKPSSPVINNGRSTKDHHTDEKLVAAQIYYVLGESKRPTIITADNDLKRIYFNVMSMLLSNYGGKNSKMKMALRYVPSTLVIVDGEDNQSITEILSHKDIKPIDPRKAYGNLRKKVRIVKRVFNKMKYRKSGCGKIPR